MRHTSISFDQGNRLKTRKLLGVGGGEKSHSISKITQIIGSDTYDNEEEVDQFIWYSNCVIMVVTFTFSILMLVGTRSYGVWVFNFLTYTVLGSQVDEGKTRTTAQVSDSLLLLQEDVVIRHYGAVYMVLALSILYGLSFANRNGSKFVQFIVITYLLVVLLVDLLTGQWATARCSLFLLLLTGYLGYHFNLLVRGTPSSWQDLRRRLFYNRDWTFWQSDSTAADSVIPTALINIIEPDDN